MHSEDSETKLKLFVWPTNDGISMVGGTGVPFDPTSTARICFRGHNLVEHKSRSIFVNSILMVS